MEGSVMIGGEGMSKLVRFIELQNYFSPSNG